MQSRAAFYSAVQENPGGEAELVALAEDTALATDLQIQNENLRTVIRAMREEMEQLGAKSADTAQKYSFSDKSGTCESAAHLRACVCGGGGRYVGECGCACMHVCAFVWVGVFVCLYACVCARMRACVFLCGWVCLCVCTRVCVRTHACFCASGRQ